MQNERFRQDGEIDKSSGPEQTRGRSIKVGPGTGGTGSGWGQPSDSLSFDFSGEVDPQFLHTGPEGGSIHSEQCSGAFRSG